jgi:tetratricopeptide (TPR) repeat protein
MKARRQVTIVASLCLVFSMAGSVLVLRDLDRIRPQATLDEVLYISSPQVLKRASLGYDGLMACIYWTRAVQYFGARHHAAARSYNELAPLLNITTKLDPHLIVAYQFGASFLAPAPPAGAGQPDQAVQLMQYGIGQNPEDWRLYYSLGFVYYTELKDYAKAADAFSRGAKIPDAHPFLGVLAAQMASHAGDFATARMLWSATYQSTKDKLIRQNAFDHLRALRVDEDVTNLQAAVTRFAERMGRPPFSLLELVDAEALPPVLADPDGNPYLLMPDGQIMVQHPDNFPFITRGIPPGYKPTYHDRLAR